MAVSIRSFVLVLGLVACARTQSPPKPDASIVVPVEPRAVASSPAPREVPPAAKPGATNAPLAPSASCSSAAPDRSATSPDGTVEVFVHVDPSRKVETALGEHDFEELCIKRAGGPAAVLLSGRGTAEMAPDRTLAGFAKFVFSPDSKTLYFTSTGWVTSAAAHAVDLATGSERFLVDGEIERVITKGPFKGHLVASHFRLDNVYPVDSPKYRGRMDTASILTVTGKLVRALPEDDAAQAKVLAEH